MSFANYGTNFFFHPFLRLLIHRANNSMAHLQKLEVLVCWKVPVSKPIIFFSSWLGEKGCKSLFALPTVYLLYLSQGTSTRHSRHQSYSVWWRPFPLSSWKGDSHSFWGALPLGRAKMWRPPRGRDWTHFKPQSTDFGQHSLSEVQEHPHIFLFNLNTTEAKLN